MQKRLPAADVMRPLRFQTERPRFGHLLASVYNPPPGSHMVVMVNEPGGVRAPMETIERCTRSVIMLSSLFSLLGAPCFPTPLPIVDLLRSF